MRSVVISVDAELAFGYHDISETPPEQVERYRDAWSWLIDRCHEYDIPCTWAVVGHLFLDNCDGCHRDHPSTPEWFDRDPGGDETTAPGWFGGSLVEAIQESPVDHEIGSHTFSHVEFGVESTTDEIASAELRRSVDLAAEWGLSLDSVVFPRNSVGHLDLVKEYGFRYYRSRMPGRWYHQTPVRRTGKTISYTIGRSAPPIVEPRLDRHGLVDLPASLYLFSFEGIAKSIVKNVTEDPVSRQVRLGLNELADRTGGVLHLWLHPNNLTAETDRRRLERLFRLIDRHRAEHGIPVRTMRSVGNAVQPS